MRLVSTDLPAVYDPIGPRFTVESRAKPMRCHEFREAVDKIKVT